MRLEIFEDEFDGIDLVVFEGTDVVAILYTFDWNEVFSFTERKS